MDTKERQVKVSWELDGERFDKVAHSLASGWFSAPLPRSLVQDAIIGGTILLNKSLTKAKTRVSREDTLFFSEEFFRAITQKDQRSAPSAEEPVIIAENEDFLVISKPAGWLTHEVSGYQKEASLEDWLLKKGLLSADVPNNGRVHRLDRNTSGIILYARNAKIQEELKTLFQARKVQKTYIALVDGHLQELQGSISAPIARKKGSFKRFVSLENKEEQQKEAETFYTVIASSKDYDLLFIEPKTGRTHQIRAHMEHLGHSIAGDTLYGGKKSLLHRQFLHAFKISFVFRGSRFSFFAPLYPDLKKVLTTLDAEPFNRYDNEALQTIGLKQRKGFFSLFRLPGRYY